MSERDILTFFCLVFQIILLFLLQEPQLESRLELLACSAEHSR